MRDETLACEIVARALGVAAVAPGDDMQSIAGWDSLGHMAIVAELEQAVGMPLSPEQIVSIASVRDVTLLLAEHAEATAR